MNHGGRPRSTDPKLFRPKLNLTVAEMADLQRRAALAGCSVAEYLRRRALGPVDVSPAVLSLSAAGGISRR